MAGNTIWTINKLITWTTHYFKDHHIESPRLDAEILLAHVLNKSRIYLYTNFDLIVNPDELAMYRGYIKKRIEGYSVAAITGEKEFMGLTFKLSENTLIPRQDTETWLERSYSIIEMILNCLSLILGRGAELFFLASSTIAKVRMVSVLIYLKMRLQLPRETEFS